MSSPARAKSPSPRTPTRTSTQSHATPDPSSPSEPSLATPDSTPAPVEEQVSPTSRDKGKASSSSRGTPGRTFTCIEGDEPDGEADDESKPAVRPTRDASQQLSRTPTNDSDSGSTDKSDATLPLLAQLSNDDVSRAPSPLADDENPPYVTSSPGKESEDATKPATSHSSAEVALSNNQTVLCDGMAWKEVEPPPRGSPSNGPDSGWRPWASSESTTASSTELSSGKRISLRDARNFMSYYCARFDFAQPIITYYEAPESTPQRTLWIATLRVRERRIGVGQGPNKKDARSVAYLDATQYLESCDPEMWKQWARVKRSLHQVEPEFCGVPAATPEEEDGPATPTDPESETGVYKAAADEEEPTNDIPELLVPNDFIESIQALSTSIAAISSSSTSTTTPALFEATRDALVSHVEEALWRLLHLAAEHAGLDPDKSEKMVGAILEDNLREMVTKRERAEGGGSVVDVGEGGSGGVGGEETGPSSGDGGNVECPSPTPAKPESTSQPRRSEVISPIYIPRSSKGQPQAGVLHPGRIVPSSLPLFGTGDLSTTRADLVARGEGGSGGGVGEETGPSSGAGGRVESQPTTAKPESSDIDPSEPAVPSPRSKNPRAGVVQQTLVLPPSAYWPLFGTPTTRADFRPSSSVPARSVGAQPASGPAAGASSSSNPFAPPVVAPTTAPTAVAPTPAPVDAPTAAPAVAPTPAANPRDISFSVGGQPVQFEVPGAGAWKITFEYESGRGVVQAPAVAPPVPAAAPPVPAVAPTPVIGTNATNALPTPSHPPLFGTPSTLIPRAPGAPPTLIPGAPPTRIFIPASAPQPTPLAPPPPYTPLPPFRFPHPTPTPFTTTPFRPGDLTRPINTFPNVLLPETFDTITAQPPYDRFSQEELRVAAYQTRASGGAGRGEGRGV